MLLINKTGMHDKALGFFTESGTVIPFSVDLSDFCRSFREERNTTIKIHKSHHVLRVNEVYNVIKKSSLFDIRTTIWSKIILRTQNRMNCKLCRILSGQYGFFLVVHRFLQREKSYSNTTKVEHWTLIGGRYCWDLSPVIGYVGSWKKRVAAVEEDF